MASNLDSLVTKVAKDRGYSPEQPSHPSGMRGFVCPRANAYGGRDGIIPPGVAAQRGLVPKGMRKIAVSDTGKTSCGASEAGKSEIDTYMDYYGSAASAEGVRETKADRAPAAPRKEPTVHAETEVVSDSVLGEPANRMFSAPQEQAGRDDTLDGFYDSLPPSQTGTRPRRRQEKQAVMGVDYGRNEATVIAEVRHTEQGLELAGLQKMADDEASLRNRVAELTEERDSARAQLLSLKMELNELKARPMPPAPRHSETVRVVLSSEEEKIKLGGKGWECRIMGAVSLGRTGSDLILSVSDPGYASEVMSGIQPGRVILVRASGRTSCMYSGQCAKIYGDSSSSDFIALFRMAVDDESTA